MFQKFLNAKKSTQVKGLTLIVGIILTATVLVWGIENVKGFIYNLFHKEDQPVTQQFVSRNLQASMVELDVDTNDFMRTDNPYELAVRANAEGETPKSLLIIYSVLPQETLDQQLQLSQIDFLSQAIQSYWNTTVEMISAEAYIEGLIYDYDITFVIDENGISNYQLFTDVAHSRNKEIVWMGQSAGRITSLTFYDTSLLINRGPTMVDTVEYEGYEFIGDTIAYPLPPLGDVNDFGLQADETRTFEIAASYTDVQGSEGVFALDINENILILPFSIPSYYETEIFTTVFLDLLHRSIGKGMGEPVAMLRLEDVNAYTFGDNRRLWDVYHYLKSEDIRFNVALIARYINKERHLDLSMDDRGNYLELLRIMFSENYATFIQHGYDHQVGDEISAIGYEFWDEQRNAPLMNDSVELVRETVTNAQQAMVEQGLPVPDIWETPHYALSSLDHLALQPLYPLRYEHIPGFGSLPFTVRYNNVIYIPETLGYVKEASDVDAIVHRLDLISVFDAPVASFFWHPWREQSELEYLTQYIRSKGYEFAGAYDLLDAPQGSPALANISRFQISYQQSSEYWLYENKTEIVFFSFLLFVPGAMLFIQQRVSVMQYFKSLKSFDMSIEDLEKLSKEIDRPLPSMAILVPARNEGLVIGNTLRRLAALDYPKHLYHILIITDERELDDDVECTTKDVTLETKKEIFDHYGVDFVDVIEVPKWYSGRLHDTHHTFEKSTKGRALNYALQILYSDPRFSEVEMFGVLDADGRLHTDVLKEVAYKRMTKDARILQGPVFQVSNFKNVDWVGVGAGLELAMHHLTELPSRLMHNRVQFLAGTNYFIDKNLIVQVGGWDQKALVEDAELALRIYMRTGDKAQWLSKPELEQSPPNFRVYRRQRERWARGHLYLIPTILQSTIPLEDKVHFMMTIIISQFRFILDVGFPIVALIFMLLGSYRYFDTTLMIISLSFMVISFLVWDSYGFTYRLLREYIQGETTLKNRILFSLKYFILTPAFIFVQAVPRVMAIYNFTFMREKVQWYKTERTREEIVVEF